MDGAIMTACPACSAAGGFGVATGVGDGAAFLLCGTGMPAAVDMKNSPASTGIRNLIRPLRNRINGVPGSSSELKRQSSIKNPKRHCTRGDAGKALRKNFANHRPRLLLVDTA